MTNKFLKFLQYHKRCFGITSHLQKKPEPVDPFCFNRDLEHAINCQVNAELGASYTYLAMATYCSRQNICLPGCEMFYAKQAADEREHAQVLIDYINRRGGTVCFYDIHAPCNQTWTSVLCTFTEALELEKVVSQKLVDLHLLAEDIGDPSVSDLIQTEYLTEQVRSIHEITQYITILERMGDGLGLELFDRYLLKAMKKS